MRPTGCVPSVRLQTPDHPHSNNPQHLADNGQVPDPRKMQVALVGFMDKYGAASFVDELWKLLLSAQATVGGVPAEFIEAKKKELEAQNRGGPGAAGLQNQMRQRAEALNDDYGRRVSGNFLRGSADNSG